MIPEPIGVLCGGPSAEREISLKSGRAVHEALVSLGWPSLLVELSQDPGEIPGELEKAHLGCAFVALHGPFGEDGTIQAILEDLKVPYTGSSPEASRYAMDKITARRRWVTARLPIPKWLLADPVNAEFKAKEIGFPLVVKPVNQGSSFGISLVESLSDLALAIQEAAQYGERFLLEELLVGQEITVGILEDRPLPVIQIVPKRRFYDFLAKYTPGMTEYLVPAPLDQKTTSIVQECAIQAHQALGCRSFSRVDLILTSGRGPVLLELNTIPGMTATSLLPKAAQCAGMDFPQLCHRMLISCLEGKGASLLAEERTPRPSASSTGVLTDSDPSP